MTTPQRLAPPSPRVLVHGGGLTMVDPISRRGDGPGLLVLVPEASSGLFIDHGVPSPFQKWGEEGYAVVEVTAAAFRQREASDIVRLAIEALKSGKHCQPAGMLGVVAYDPALWAIVAPLIEDLQIQGAVVYADAIAINEVAPSSIPTLVHAAGKANRKLLRNASRVEYDYPAQLSDFASPRLPGFDYATEAVSHTRSLTHLKKLMDGPHFDLEAIWEEHTYYEFDVRDVPATMNTMVEEPYVNHIPTLTGGIGRKDLTDFYQNHFVFSNPKDTELEVVSRTIGIDRVVDEFILKMTHDRVVDWLFPGIPPTGKYVEVPFMAVVNVRGDRLYHEHITWDHASALRQIGLIPETLPYQETTNGIGSKMHHTNGTDPGLQVMVLPIAGSDTSAKLRNKNAIKSNAMFTEAGPKVVNAA